MFRSARRMAVLLALMGGLVWVGATSAQAEDGYRFWAYYQWTDGKWAFATKGSDQVVPKDGGVEGWRFAVGGKKPRTPRTAGDFEAICGQGPTETGKKRVALVIDPGTPQDAVSGDTAGQATGICVTTDPQATGAKVLAAATEVRIEKGITCALGGYPSKGCGDQVKNINVPATEATVELHVDTPVGNETSPNSPPGGAADQDADDADRPWLVVGLPIAALVVFLGIGAVALSRRRRRGQHT